MNNKSGFIETIILIIIALIIMKFLGITVSQVLAWFAAIFHWFAAFFRDVLK